MRTLLFWGVLLLASVPALGQCPDGTPPPCGPRLAARTAPASNSVAVLYFDNVSQDTTEAYLADGLTISLIDRLAAAGLPVASRFQVRRYRRAEGLDPMVVSRALAVAHLLSGSVHRTGNRVRISVELIRAPSGVRVWGRQFDRPADDLLAIEADIATTVADSITGRLPPAQRAALARSPTISPRAYEHLLRGNYLMNAISVRNQEGAIAEYEAALRLDPSATVPHARLAHAWAICIDRSLACRRLPRDSATALGERLAREAIRLDSTMADAWVAYAVLLYGASSPRLSEALRAAQRAVALDPQNPAALTALGGLQVYSRNDSAGEATLSRAILLDPSNAVALGRLQPIAMSRRRLPEAMALADSSIAAGSEHALAFGNRAFLRGHLGDTAGTRADAENYARLLGRPPVYVEAFVLMAKVAAGDTTNPAAIEAFVERLVRDPAWAAAGPMAIHLPAWILGRLGRVDAAVRALPKPSYMSWSVSRYPHFDAIRNDPGFQRWVESARAMWMER